nr:PepSY domain-containing protein [uncultured Sellimonas sp.]
MKKKMLVTAAVTLTLIGLVAGCGGKDIGESKAKEIALENAGVTESDISRYQSSKDRDDGKTLYEIQFASGDTEYEYEINAENGNIISYGSESLNNGQSSTQNNTETTTDNSGTNSTDTSQSQDNSQNTTANNTGVNVQFSEADAKAAALERVPGATEQDLRMELDHDDGKYIYEGDIIYQQMEYEFEIDANTGKFLKWSEERA